MKKTVIVSIALLLSLASLLASAASGPGPSVLYDRAKRAIAAGNVVPERDLAPLVDVLRGPSSEEDLRTAIDRIETLADAGDDAKSCSGRTVEARCTDEHTSSCRALRSG